jgi:DNA-binding NarL/FixJ family response regulator
LSACQGTRRPSVVLFGHAGCDLLRTIDIEVLAVVESSDSAVALTCLHVPDVVVVDLRTCRSYAATVIRDLVRACPAVPVLAVDGSADENTLVSMVRAGARGFVTGPETPAQVAHAVQVLAAGSALFGADAAKHLLARFSRSPELVGYPFSGLTRREREVLDLVAAGQNDGAIARHLDLAPKTIRNNVSSIITKLHVTGRADIIKLAREADRQTGFQ